MTETPITFVDVVLTCHTEECGNDGVAVTLTVPDGAVTYTCGACGQPITDVTTT